MRELPLSLRMIHKLFAGKLTMYQDCSAEQVGALAYFHAVEFLHSRKPDYFHGVLSRSPKVYLYRNDGHVVYIEVFNDDLPQYVITDLDLTLVYRPYLYRVFGDRDCGVIQVLNSGQSVDALSNVADHLRGYLHGIQNTVGSDSENAVDSGGQTEPAGAATIPNVQSGSSPLAE
ncbi:hypothetical protein YOLOSWAG_54 [Erwinia phage vB_EamM_Yoloswag]|uniref:Uncharacterized protein n=1 Tax=Erwinia phage vB_EamM_Yoloswag TaxID=1958956 RepID=A0A1S6L2Y1_9CAUD|nr:hypothetical protein HOR66_gp054 [Erwinia phage vB_EamM_Yoloswag]AQT28538.1 hypothetical protein YOLOSWAG_54 [Erwinia phage vB_EamM_Yoloswag]